MRRHPTGRLIISGLAAGQHTALSGLSPCPFNPALTCRLQEIEFTEPVRTAFKESCHIRDSTGPGFLWVGDSHRFTDPIFSFGVCFSANEAKLAAGAIAEVLSRSAERDPNPVAAYEATSDFGQQVIEDVIDVFWEYPLAFQMMAHKSHTGEITDCFAGRVYPAHQPSEAVVTMRRMLNRLRNSQAAAPLEGSVYASSDSARV